MRRQQGLASFCTGSALLIATLAISGCSNDSTASTTPGVAISQRYRGYFDNLGSSVALAKSSATSAGPVTPADLASLPRVPGALTGSTDIGAEQSGKTGEKSVNLDGAGAEEAATIFVPDAPTGGGTSASLPSFLAWKGDEGLCYLGWTKGATTWVVSSSCGNTTGAWICQVTSDDVVCNGCSTAGECTPCDTTQSSLTSCAWPP